MLFAQIIGALMTVGQDARLPGRHLEPQRGMQSASEGLGEKGLKSLMPLRAFESHEHGPPRFGVLPPPGKTSGASQIAQLNVKTRPYPRSAPSQA